MCIDTIPEPYRTPESANQSRIYAVRFDEELFEDIQKAALLASDIGYKTEADVIRTGAALVMEAILRSTNVGKEQLKRRRVLVDLEQADNKLSKLEHTFLIRPIQRMTTLVLDDAWDEAIKVLNVTQGLLEAWPNPAEVSSITERFARRPIVIQIRRYISNNQGALDASPNGKTDPGDSTRLQPSVPGVAAVPVGSTTGSGVSK